MSSTGARGGGPLDDDALERALAAGLARATDGGVDTDALVRGAHAGARRIHRRRTAVRGTVAALCVVALVPLGISTFGAFGGGPASDSAGSAAGPVQVAAGDAAVPETGATPRGATSALGGAVTPAASAPPARVAAGTANGTVAPGPQPGEQYSAAPGRSSRSGGEVLVADSAMLTEDDLGLAPVRITEDVAGVASAATTVVRLCGVGGPGEELARGGRTVRWAGPAVGTKAWAVATSVRVFAADGAAQQLAHLERAVGTCAASPGVSRVGVDGLPGDDVLVAVLPASADGTVRVVGAVRRGKVTAGVEVVVPPDAAGTPDARRDAGVARVRTQLARGYERLAELAAAADADPALR